jgi:uncharacterized protein YlxW (UPF0749 family)
LEATVQGSSLHARSLLDGSVLRVGQLQPGRLRNGVVALIVGVAIGVLLVSQWQSPAASVATGRQHFTQQTIDRLEAEQADLKKQITDARASIAAEQQRLSQGKSEAAELSRTLDEQQAIAGTVPLAGPGIEVVLDDSMQRPVLATDDPNNFIVHEYQIRDVVNLLWEAGAVGISVNGERFVNSTSVYCVGTTILINDTRTSPPYKIWAVGDPASLKAALADGNALKDVKSRALAYGIVFQVGRTDAFTLPAFDGSIDLKNSTVATESP